MPPGNRTLVRLLVAAAAVLALWSSPALASPAVRYGVQDDAWLEYGPGTLNDRLTRLQTLGVDVVRVNVLWSRVEATQGQYDWSAYDPIVEGLHERGIEPLLTLVSTPSWANGGRAANWAPTSGSSFASFAAAAQRHYPFVRRWLVWNEPNHRTSLRPTTPAVYVRRLLNPAYGAIHDVNPRALVAGGVTAPRAATGGVSPVAWIAGMAAAHAKLDAYAHNPYPLSPSQTPLTGGCDHCTTLTMATLPRLLADVSHAFGARTRIWLTEYGYQTNPPDTFLGVSPATQATYMGEAALRAYETPRVDLLIHYLVQDEPDLGGWQSGILWDSGKRKPSYRAIQMPLTVKSQTATKLTLWGQIRPGSGRQPYVLEERRGGSWIHVGSVERTSPQGYFTRVVAASARTPFRVLQITRGLTSATLTAG